VVEDPLRYGRLGDEGDELVLCRFALCPGSRPELTSWKLQVGGEGGRGRHVAAVEHGEEHVGRGGLGPATLELPEAHVVDHHQRRAAPGPHALLVGAVGEPGVEPAFDPGLVIGLLPPAATGWNS